MRGGTVKGWGSVAFSIRHQIRTRNQAGKAGAKGARRRVESKKLVDYGQENPDRFDPAFKPLAAVEVDD